MSTISFKDWLLQTELATPAPVTPVGSGPQDPSVAMAQTAVKTAMAKPNVKQPLAAQARVALSQAAAKAPDPMKVASLDQGTMGQPGQPGQPNAGMQ